jgi:hypothetical protein
MSWTAEGGLSRGDTDADFKRACFYDNLEPEFILSELFWTALRSDKLFQWGAFNNEAKKVWSDYQYFLCCGDYG